MQYLKYNTSAYIHVGPFLSTSDGYTLKTALTIANSKLSLLKNNTNNSASTYVIDNATCATNGTNALNYVSGDDHAMMTLALAAADTQFYGHGRVSVVDAANHLPVWEDICVLPGVVYDSLILGDDLLDVNTSQIAGSNVSTGAAQIGVNLVNVAGSAVNTTAAQLGVNLVNIAGSAVNTTSAQLGVNVIQVNSTTQTATFDSLSSQISAIGSGVGAALNFEVTDDNTDAPLNSVTFIGTQVGTFARTLADDNSDHEITSASDAGTEKIRLVYKFSCGGGRNASKLVVRAHMAAVTDTVTVKVWDFSGTPAWDTMATITGTTETLYDIPLYSGHTGTGADAGIVYVYFDYDEADAGTLHIDQCYVTAQNLGQTIGYANGSIWIEADGGNTGTTPYVDGTGDNPCTYAAAKTLSTTLGIKRFTVEPGTTITLDAALTGAVMTGRSYTLALGGQNIAASYFEGIESLSGTGVTSPGAEAIFVDCHVGTVTLGEFDFVRCHLHGTVTMGTASKYYRIHNCTGIENATIEFGAATQTLALSEMSGAITVTGMTAGDTLYADGNGALTLNGDGGTVHISGNIELTISSTGQTITYGATKLGDLAHGGAAATLTLVSPVSAQLADGVQHGGLAATLLLDDAQIGSQSLATRLDANISLAVNAANSAYGVIMERGISAENWDGSQSSPVAITFSGTGTGEVCFCEWTPTSGAGASLFYYNFGTQAISLDGTFDNGPWTSNGVVILDDSTGAVITAPGTLSLSVKDANGLTRTYSWHLGTIADWGSTMLLKDGTVEIVGGGSMSQPTTGGGGGVY